MLATRAPAHPVAPNFRPRPTSLQAWPTTGHRGRSPPTRPQPPSGLWLAQPSTTMQLHRLLAHKAHGRTQLVLGTGHGATPLNGGRIELEAGVVAHGAGQFELHLHIGHAVAQGLETGDHHAKLLALVHVFGSELERLLHHAHAFGAQGGVVHILSQRQRGQAVRGDQRGVVAKPGKSDERGWFCGLCHRHADAGQPDQTSFRSGWPDHPRHGGARTCARTHSSNACGVQRRACQRARQRSDRIARRVGAIPTRPAQSTGSHRFAHCAR